MLAQTSGSRRGGRKQAHLTLQVLLLALAALASGPTARAEDRKPAEAVTVTVSSPIHARWGDAEVPIGLTVESARDSRIGVPTVSVVDARHDGSLGVASVAVGFVAGPRVVLEDEAGHLASYRPSLEGPLAPGRYEVHIAVVTPTASDKASFRLYVRASWWWAVIIIGLGVGVSLALSFLTGHVEPRLAREVAVARLRSRLVARFGADSPWHPRFTRELDELLLLGPSEEDFQERVGTLSTRLRNLIRFEDMLAWERELDDLPPNRATPVRERIRRVRGDLERKGLEGLDDLDALRSEIDAVYARYEQGSDAGVMDEAVAGHTQAAPTQRSLPATVERLETTQRKVVLVKRAVVAVVTIVAGMLALYADEPDWGTTLDLFVAFFWGLGLDVTGNLTAATVVERLGARR